MDRFLVPADVEAALARVGFRPVDVAGTGWLAVALDGTDRRLELHVVPAALEGHLAARADRLRALRHEHLARLLDVIELSPGRLGLAVEHVAGLTLDQVRAARSPLTDGEAATVAIPVAGALGVLHDAGLVHGAVSASAVVLRPDGRPVLTDLRGALLGSGEAEADVRRLVTTVVAQLPGEDVHPADQPSLRGALVDLLTVPGLGAGQVVDRCYRVTEPAPLRLPDVRATGASAPATRARRDVRAGRDAGRRRRLRLSVAAAAAVVLVVGGLAGRHLLVSPAASVPGHADVVSAPVSGSRSTDPGSSAPEPAVTGPGGSPVTDRGDPVAAATELSRLRAAAVGAGDAGALGAVEVADGPAHTADVLLLAGHGPQEGLAADVQDAWLVADDGTRGSTTDVAVTAAMSSATRTGSPPRTVVLGLRWTDEGWRVWDVVQP